MARALSERQRPHATPGKRRSAESAEETRERRGGAQRLAKRRSAADSGRREDRKHTENRHRAADGTQGCLSCPAGQLGVR